ncbi:serine hydrolase domain-containing protein [Streptomyces sp. NPDC051162]|uniref:serine hydrolase domain-containing protein n=1 Tax=unclassified Streptomyces TaxID=2593676 RepID=UPI00343C4C7F
MNTPDIRCQFAQSRPSDLPGAAPASVKDREGRTRTYTAGVGDLTTGSKVPADGQVRIGSNTKTFTAVVVLQLLAGLIVQKVTGRPLAQEIDRRIIEPVGLRHTYFPAPGDVTIREPHPKGYYQDSAGAPLRDGTELDPSWGWAAGQMISTNSDLDRFYTALLGGRLLPAAQLAQMRTTVPAGYPFASGVRYGLGLTSTPLSCGGVYWGHGGSTTGYETRGGATEDGRAAGVAVTVQPDQATKDRVERVVDTALCRK